MALGRPLGSPGVAAVPRPPSPRAVRVCVRAWQPAPLLIWQAAVAHEAGHVLGFHHPDTAPDDNLESLCAIDNATCHDPWGCAALRHYDTSQNSIMQWFLSKSVGLHHIF